jgi:GLPGLI family protein
MNIYLFVIIQLIAYTNVFAQKQEQICFVKYKSFESESFLYNTWLFKDTVMYEIEYVFDKMFSEFPVFNDFGKPNMETDTIKYNKEYRSFLGELRNSRVGYIQTHKRAYNSKIVNIYWAQPNVTQQYTIVDTLNEMDYWKIFEDTSTVLNFKCQKATINYNNEVYTAWFTIQLPYNAGPQKFMGLPGLILKISNEKQSKGFEAIELKKPYKEQYFPYFEKIDRKITIKEYEKIVSTIWNEISEKAKKTNR